MSSESFIGDSRLSLFLIMLIFLSYFDNFSIVESVEALSITEILVFDEPTNSLDEETEKKISTTLFTKECPHQNTRSMIKSIRNEIQESY